MFEFDAAINRSTIFDSCCSPVKGANLNFALSLPILRKILKTLCFFHVREDSVSNLILSTFTAEVSKVCTLLSDSKRKVFWEIYNEPMQRSLKSPSSSWKTRKTALDRKS